MRMPEEQLEAYLEAEKDFHQNVMPKTRAAIRELIQETDPDFQRQARFEYLSETMTNLIVEALILMNRYEDYYKRGRVLERLLTGETILILVKKIIVLQAEAIVLKHPEKVTDGRIDENSIRRAREYPFTDLLEFRMNQARCPFHEDRTPSMHFYQAENRVHCFSCGKGWDPIAFVMEKDGLTFPEAVKRLL